MKVSECHCHTEICEHIHWEKRGLTSYLWESFWNLCGSLNFLKPKYTNIFVWFIQNWCPPTQPVPVTWPGPRLTFVPASSPPLMSNCSLCNFVSLSVCLKTGFRGKTSTSKFECSSNKLWKGFLSIDKPEALIQKSTFSMHLDKLIHPWISVKCDYLSMRAWCFTHLMVFRSFSSQQIPRWLF